MTTLHTSPDGPVAYSKGSPEVILDSCTHQLTESGETQLKQAEKEAILWELVLLALIIYLPFLRVPFGTFSLSLVDWIIIVGLALTVSPVLELAKWMERRGWFGKLT